MTRGRLVILVLSAIAAMAGVAQAQEWTYLGSMCDSTGSYTEAITCEIVASRPTGPEAADHTFVVALPGPPRIDACWEYDVTITVSAVWNGTLRACSGSREHGYAGGRLRTDFGVPGEQTVLAGPRYLSVSAEVSEEVVEGQVVVSVSEVCETATLTGQDDLVIQKRLRSGETLHVAADVDANSDVRSGGRVNGSMELVVQGIVSVTARDVILQAVDDVAMTSQGVAVVCDVFENDNWRGAQSPTLARAWGAAHGTTTAHENGLLIYTPDPGWIGIDTVQYRSALGDCEVTGSLRVEVSDVPEDNLDAWITEFLSDREALEEELAEDWAVVQEAYPFETRPGLTFNDVLRELLHIQIMQEERVEAAVFKSLYLTLQVLQRTTPPRVSEALDFVEFLQSIEDEGIAPEWYKGPITLTSEAAAELYTRFCEWWNEQVPILLPSEDSNPS